MEPTAHPEVFEISPGGEGSDIMADVETPLEGSEAVGDTRARRAATQAEGDTPPHRRGAGGTGQGGEGGGAALRAWRMGAGLRSA